MYVEMQDRVCSTCALSYYSRAVEVYISVKYLSISSSIRASLS